MQVEACRVKSGDYVPGYGFVKGTTLFHQSVADRSKSILSGRPKKFSALKAARLMAEALGECYQYSPYSVVITFVGRRACSFKTTTLITVERPVFFEERIAEAA